MLSWTRVRGNLLVPLAPTTVRPRATASTPSLPRWVAWGRGFSAVRALSFERRTALRSHLISWTKADVA